MQAVQSSGGSVPAILKHRPLVYCFIRLKVTMIQDGCFSSSHHTHISASYARTRRIWSLHLRTLLEVAYSISIICLARIQTATNCIGAEKCERYSASNKILHLKHGFCDIIFVSVLYKPVYVYSLTKQNTFLQWFSNF